MDHQIKTRKTKKYKRPRRKAKRPRRKAKDDTKRRPKKAFKMTRPRRPVDVPETDNAPLWQTCRVCGTVVQESWCNGDTCVDCRHPEMHVPCLKCEQGKPEASLVKNERLYLSAVRIFNLAMHQRSLGMSVHTNADQFMRDSCPPATEQFYPYAICRHESFVCTYIFSAKFNVDKQLIMYEWIKRVMDDKPDDVVIGCEDIIDHPYSCAFCDP